MIDDQVKLKEIEREIKYRRWVYSRLVNEGQMRQETADKQIKIMEAIADDYRQKIQPSFFVAQK